MPTYIRRDVDLKKCDLVGWAIQGSCRFKSCPWREILSYRMVLLAPGPGIVTGRAGGKNKATMYRDKREQNEVDRFALALIIGLVLSGFVAGVLAMAVQSTS